MFQVARAGPAMLLQKTRGQETTDNYRHPLQGYFGDIRANCLATFRRNLRKAVLSLEGEQQLGVGYSRVGTLWGSGATPGCSLPQEPPASPVCSSLPACLSLHPSSPSTPNPFSTSFSSRFSPPPPPPFVLWFLFMFPWD